MTKWEYYVGDIDTGGGAQSILDDLNRHGEEGWELAAVAPTRVGDERPGLLVAMFKRQAKPDAPTEPLIAAA
jgi:hypothetical protein